MKLSTKGRYALRLMLELAQGQSRQPMLLRDIASRQQISPRYLEQLVLNLKAAGLVKSVRGARGGFLLARPAEKISLLDIYQASEGSSALVECLEDAGLCSRSRECASREVWLAVRNAMTSTLQNWTLSQLLDQQREKNRPAEVMYYI